MVSFSRYRKLVQEGSPTERKEYYKLHEKELKTRAKERYERPEKIRKNIEKRIEKLAETKVRFRRVLAPTKRATIRTTIGGW